MLVLGAISAERSLSILAELAVKHDLPNLSSIAYKAGGDRLAKFLEILIIVMTLGSCVAFQIILVSLIQYTIIEFGADKMIINSTWFRGIMTTCSAILIILPLSLKTEMHAFRYVSIISIIALVYTAIVMLYEVPWYFNHYYESADISPAYFDLNMFTGCSITFFAYQCQVNLLPIYSEMVNPNFQRVTKVI